MNWSEIFLVAIIVGLAYFFLGAWLDSLNSPFVNAGTVLLVIGCLIGIYLLAHWVEGIGK